MENIEKCECCVGIISDYDNTSMTTLDGLKYHIKDRLELKQAFEKDVFFKGYNHGIKGWTLDDYCDKRKSTDLTRFNYCPLCGKRIDWKAMKGGRMADIINEKLKPSKTFNWFFEPYALVEPQKIKQGFCPKCYAKVNSENNTNCCGFCGQSLEWEGYNG